MEGEGGTEVTDGGGRGVGEGGGGGHLLPADRALVRGLEAAGAPIRDGSTPLVVEVDIGAAREQRGIEVRGTAHVRLLLHGEEALDGMILELDVLEERERGGEPNPIVRA